MNPHDSNKPSDQAGATKPVQTDVERPMAGGESSRTEHTPLAGNDRKGRSGRAEKKHPHAGHDPAEMNRKPGHGQPDPHSGQHGGRPPAGDTPHGDHKSQNPAGPGQKR